LYAHLQGRGVMMVGGGLVRFSGPIFAFWPLGIGINCQDQQKIFANFIL